MYVAAGCRGLARDDRHRRHVGQDQVLGLGPLGLLGGLVGGRQGRDHRVVHRVVLVRVLGVRGERVAAIAEERGVQEVVDAEPVAVPADEERGVVPRDSAAR